MFLTQVRDLIVDPIGLLFLLSLCFLCVLAWKRLNLCLVLGGLIWVGAVCFASAPSVVNPMLVYFESQFSAEPECLAARPIVLLGGGIRSDATKASQVESLYPRSYVRAIAARNLARRYPDVPVLIAGGGIAEVSEAAVMSHLLVELGIDESRLYAEGTSANTYENAVNIKKLIDGREFDEHINLVTAALHMKRAKATFEKQGLTVCAVGVDKHGLENVPLYTLWPQMTALTKFDSVLHEVVGLVFYKIAGRL